MRYITSELIFIMLYIQTQYIYVKTVPPKKENGFVILKKINQSKKQHI